MMNRHVLVSGAGIAGLTLAIQLKQHGFEPVVIERELAPREEGYMMDFFGTGWDVAERMNLVERLRAIRYPIDAMNFVTGEGETWLEVPIARVRAALGNKYVYLRRQDLERILRERAAEAGIAVRYGTSLHALAERGERVHATFVGGAVEDFDLVIGSDGVHSRVRTLAFGPERKFTRFLGLYVAAFHTRQNGYGIGRSLKLYEEVDRTAWLYPLDDERMDATYMFRNDDPDIITSLGVLRRKFRGTGWVADDVLGDIDLDTPLYIDSATQIVMPDWHAGRIALIGDACGCLTLLAGQGSHMAMAGGYLLAQELAKQNDHRDAFAAYQAALKPHVDRKQREAARFATLLVPGPDSWPWLRRLAMRLLFSPVGLKLAMPMLGSTSVLPAQH
jgi:2-polyprenyl-6-methoxyphenol hydroxylase-like FAD-dependent oxidoreductase